MSTCAIFSCIKVQTRSKNAELQERFSTVFKVKQERRPFLIGIIKKKKEDKFFQFLVLEEKAGLRVPQNHFRAVCPQS